MPENEDGKPIIPWAVEKPEIKRDENGRFLPGQSANQGNHSPGQLISSWFRQKLAEIDPKDPEARTSIERLYMNIMDIATSDNPKYRKEAVWAANLLLERAFGAPVKDKSELDAIREGGVKIQVVAIGELPPSAKPMVKPQLKPPTDWEEGEIIEGE